MCKNIQKMDNGTTGSRKLDVDWSAPWKSLKLQHRLILFTKFAHLHGENVREAVRALTLALQPSGQAIDAAHKALQFTFKYYTNNDGNPAKMFRLEGAGTVSVADNKANEFMGEKEMSAFEQTRQEALQGGRPHPLRVYTQVEEFRIGFVWEERVHAALDPETVASLEGMGSACIEMFQAAFLRGLVLVPGRVPGHMVWKGKHWTWEEFQ